jgi:uncharacterized membrane protein
VAPIPVDGDEALEMVEYWSEAAFGLHDPEEQLMGAFVLGIIIIATSALSLGWTLVLLWIPIALFWVGVFRLLWGAAS